MRGHASARIRDGHGRVVRELVLRDVEILRVGDVALMLVLTEADSAPEEINRRVLRRRGEHRRAGEGDSHEAFDDEGFDDGIFDTPEREEMNEDDLFMTNPAAGFGPDDYADPDDF